MHNKGSLKVKVVHLYIATYSTGQRRITASKMAADWHRL